MELLKIKVAKLIFATTIFLQIVLNSVYSQTNNLFSDPKLLKEFLDGKTYIIPNHGTITFEFDNSETRRMRDVRTKDGADDEVIDIIFDVKIKRNNSKRRVKGDYKVELKIDTNEYLEGEQDPRKKYLNTFSLMRNIIYIIKDFPSYYTLFADGDLYYTETKFKNVSLSEFKSTMITGEVNPFAFFGDLNNKYSSSRYIKCVPVK
jgi:hypothetical protein